MTFLPKKSAKSIAIVPVTPADLKKLDPKTRAWTESAGFSGAPGSLLLLPDGKGGLSRVLFGMDGTEGLYAYSALPAKLPKNAAGYYIDKKMDEDAASKAALGWAMGCYDFAGYKSGGKKEFAALVWPDKADIRAVTAAAESVFLVRDLINTPPNDMGPDELEAAARSVAKPFKAQIKVIKGEDLLKRNYPTIYMVGKASPRAPRLIDLTWGNAKNPKVTLVGKGIVFDTGGLNIKTGNGMELQKKDMGGSALALGLARMIMTHKLPVRLRVLMAVAENSIDGNSFRVSDVVKTRKGITVEIGNTDAEGRLVLSDALAEASTENPALLMDFATLTGHARVALGPDLPAMFCNDDKTANALLAAGEKVGDPLWRMPLWRPYLDAMSSKVADTRNDGGMAGAITAALFLERFVGKGIPWVHTDFYGWSPSSRPGRPEGGDAMSMRAAFEMIKEKFG